MLLTVVSFTAASLTVVLLPAVSAVDEVSGGRQEVKAGPEAGGLVRRGAMCAVADVKSVHASELGEFVCRPPGREVRSCEFFM